jgi:hypothetical protein
MSENFEQTASRLLWGAASGAVGTTVLNVVTYGDMLLRGRPASGVPANMAGILADRLGLASLRTENQAQEATSRREAAGALLGYVTGVGIGAAYALSRGCAGTGTPVRTGAVLGLAAMVASDAPIALSGASDPRSWSGADWLSDLVPHLAYGLATAAVLRNRCQS